MSYNQLSEIVGSNEIEPEPLDGESVEDERNAPLLNKPQEVEVKSKFFCKLWCG